MKRYLRHHYFSVAQVAVGALLGILLLHPLTTVVFYAEFNDLLSTPANSLWAFVGSRLRSEKEVINTALMPIRTEQ